ncbi:MAG: nucleotidyltransferase family protein [Christensenellaceae bacterium]|nr:nucleotidyltransferase family protein [Christensenellaceae bacterium]
MRTTAIICEYNPMTNGHVKHLNAAREQTGCDTILCVMSGSFVQRGDAAIADKYIRASVAVRAGADIVIELPTVYAISPADNFAYGAIKTIAEFPDVEYISFGSECGDINLLTKIATLLSDEPQEIKVQIQKGLRDGYSFPKARALACAAYIDSHPECAELTGILDKPNNVLGIAYINAISKLGLNVKIHTIKRESSETYNSDDITCEYPSSSAIRSAVRRGEIEKIRQYVPNDVYAYILQMRSGEDALGDIVLYKLKSVSGYDLANYYDVSGGINNRLKLSADSATSLDQLLEAAKTKNYTMARLKRICLYALFDITQQTYNDAVACPPYIHILALKESRKDILSALSVSCRNVLTRFSDVNRVDKSLRFLIKLDFTAQGTLSIINRSNYYNKKMLLI